MVTMRPNPGEFKRLRTRTEALLLSDADKRGPLMVEMDKEHVRQVTRAYTSEGASTQGGWPALSPRYAAWKKKAYPGRRILVRTRETRNRFTQPANPAHVRQFIPPFSYQFGARSAVQTKHEFGIGDPGQKLPRRSILTKTSADLAAFTRTFLQFYTKRVRQVLRHK
jgi:hypothetical protein